MNFELWVTRSVTRITENNEGKSDVDPSPWIYRLVTTQLPMFPSFMFLKREFLCLRYSAIIINFQDTECYELKDEYCELYRVFLYRYNKHGRFIAQKAWIPRDFQWQALCSGQQYKKPAVYTVGYDDNNDHDIGNNDKKWLLMCWINSREASYRNNTNKSHKCAIDKTTLKNATIKFSNNITIRIYINK